MKSDYKAAKKKAEKAVREAVREGRSPYLPVLDALEEIKHATVTRSIGLLDLPVNRIKGNKEQGPECGKYTYGIVESLFLPKSFGHDKPQNKIRKEHYKCSP